MKKGKKGKKSPKTKTIKVGLETYRRLVQTKGAYEMMFGETFSMEDIIVALLDAAPKAKARVEVVREAVSEKGSKLRQ